MASKHPPELTAAVVVKAVREARHIAGDTSSCCRIGESSEHNVWFVGSELVLRCLPATGRQDGAAEASLKRDAALSKLLRQYVRRVGIIPEVYTTVSINGWVGNLEKQVHGSSLEVARPTVRTEEDLVDLMKDLASVPVEEAMNAVDYEECRPNMKRRVSKSMQAWMDLTKSGYIRDQHANIQELLKRKLIFLNSLNEDPYQPVLLHTDFKGEHIFVNEADGAVQGVIDWSDAIVGDPCLDIAGLSLTVGLEMAKRIGIKASFSHIAVERGLLYAMCLTISNLRDRICGNDDSPEWLLRSQFRRAFEGTSLEQALS